MSLPCPIIPSWRTFSHYFSGFHQVLNRARWSPLEVSRRLLQVLVQTFVRATEQQTYHDGSTSDPPMLAGKPMMKATYAHLITRMPTPLRVAEAMLPALLPEGVS